MQRHEVTISFLVIVPVKRDAEQTSRQGGCISGSFLPFAIRHAQAVRVALVAAFAARFFGKLLGADVRAPCVVPATRARGATVFFVRRTRPEADYGSHGKAYA